MVTTTATNHDPVLDLDAIGWRGTGSLASLHQELVRQKESRVDFVASTGHLEVASIGRQLRVMPTTPQVGEWLPAEGLPLNFTAYGQMATGQDPTVPVRFARQLAETRPEIAAELMTRLWRAEPRNRLVRCLDGRVRALLSDSYRFVDNYDLVFTALEEARQVGAEVIRCRLSDNRMSLQLVDWKLSDIVRRQQAGDRQTHFAVGGDADPTHRGLLGLPERGLEDRDQVFPMLSISNSETGQGKTEVSIGLVEGFCINGLISSTAVKQIHLGTKLDAGLFRAETRMAEDRATMMKLTDAIRGAFDPKVFRALVAKANEAQAVEVQAPTSAVQNLVDAGTVTEGRRDALLEHFLGNYDKTAWGLAQAISRVSQEAPADEAAELEKLAGEVIAKPRHYAEVAVAA